MENAEREIATMTVEEQAAEIRARAAKIPSNRLTPKAPVEKGAPSYPEVEYHQITRVMSDGTGVDPSSMLGADLDVYLGEWAKKGFIVHTARIIGLQPGGLNIYFLLERKAPA